MHPVELTLTNNTQEIAAARSALDRIGLSLSAPKKPLHQLQVAIEEIISNIIKYAWLDRASHTFLVRFTTTTSTIRVEFIDDGRAYDPRNAPTPQPPGPNQRPRPGGVGIHLVRQLVDEIAYERLNDCNHLTLTKRWKPEVLKDRGAGRGK